MSKVELVVWNTGPYIKAPEFCPYKFTEINENERPNKDKMFVDIVHSNLCPICKICDFTTSTLEKPFELKTSEFVEYLTLVNEEVSTLINTQNSYLRKKDRIPLAILINPEIFDMMLRLTYTTTEEYSQVRAYILNNEIPICFILGCPVYLSRKLTKTKVMVIGEFEWK